MMGEHNKKDSKREKLWSLTTEDLPLCQYEPWMDSLHFCRHKHHNPMMIKASEHGKKKRDKIKCCEPHKAREKNLTFSL